MSGSRSPRDAIAICPVSSETTIASASVSSVMPIAARWRVPNLPLHHRIRGQRKKAGRRRDAVALNDHRAVVQRAAALEDGAQQIARHHGIQRDAAFDERAQTDVALDHDQRAGLPSIMLLHGQHNFVGHFAAFQLASQPSQRLRPMRDSRRRISD